MQRVISAKLDDQDVATLNKIMTKHNCQTLGEFLRAITKSKIDTHTDVVELKNVVHTLAELMLTFNDGIKKLIDNTNKQNTKLDQYYLKVDQLSSEVDQVFNILNSKVDLNSDFKVRWAGLSSSLLPFEPASTAWQAAVLDQARRPPLTALSNAK